jgi:hypothetical protein
MSHAFTFFHEQQYVFLFLPHNCPLYILALNVFEKLSRPFGAQARPKPWDLSNTTSIKAASINTDVFLSFPPMSPPMCDIFPSPINPGKLIDVGTY